MDKKLISTLLETKKLGQSLELFDVIEYSTNDRVKELLSAGEPPFTLVTANRQLNGRGRLGRNWEGGKSGDTLPFSFGFPVNGDINSFSSSTLAVALGVRDGLVNLIPGLSSKLKIKWPNDLLIEQQKLCGILTEIFDCNGQKYVIVGIGINTNIEDFPVEIAGHATSMKLQGFDQGNEAVLGAVCNELEKRIDCYLLKGFGSMVSDYENSLVCLNKEISVSGEKGSFICRGVNDRGELLAECQGQIRIFRAGEISIRGDFYV